MAVGDGAELFATGVVGVRADDNIFLAKDGTSDVIFDLTPGLELDYGKNAQLQGSLTLADDFSLYTDHSNLNTNLFSGDFVSKYDDGKTKMGFNAGYHELNQNSVDVRTDGRLIRRDIGTIGANGEVGISEITAVGGAVNYVNENYHPAGYVDSETLTIPVNFYYKWTPKVDLSVGYQYRNYSVKSGPAVDSSDHFFNVGARGEFTPMLTGKVAVGYTKRNLDVGGDESLLGIDSSLAYEFSPKTTAQIGLTNDFGTSPTGAQEKNLTANVLVTNKLDEQWSINGGVSYRRIQYATRTDDYWEGTIGAAYTMSANVRLVGSYVYRNYSVGDAAFSASEFDNNVFSIAANLRY